MEREYYYVAWHTGSYMEVLPVKPDSRTIHYEIKADEKEHEKLQSLIDDVNRKDVMQEHIFVRPFDETADDRDKLELKEDVAELFDFIYKLGTEKTKDYFEDMRNQNEL